MKNINRDYLVKVDIKSAVVTAPSNMKFFMTDEHTSNIFFQLDFKDTNNDKITDLINDKAPQQDYNIYSLTLRVVKPNYETKEIRAVRLKDDDPCFFIADLDSEYIDIPGTYECELFIDAHTDENDILYIERSTTNSFNYYVSESIFYNLDDTIYDEYNQSVSIRDYINELITGTVDLSGYATSEQLNSKAYKEHMHKEYITQEVLDGAIAEIDIVKIDLDNFTASNSISIKRKETSVRGDYSTALGYDTVASGYASHAEGYMTNAKEDFSHAEGNQTKATSYASHAEGYKTEAINKEATHAEGYETSASGFAAHSEGYNTKARGDYQHVQGKYNIEDTENKYAHIVGNGSKDDNDNITYSNAHTIDWEGNAWFSGTILMGKDSKELVTKEYVEKEVLSNIENHINNAISNGDIQIECDYEYDDSALVNSMTELSNGFTELSNEFTVLSNDIENSIANKADKKIAAPIYEGISSIDISTLDLANENRRYIRVVNPNKLLSIKLPNNIDADFAEIHVFIAPINNETEISFSAKDKNKLKYQGPDDMPTTLEPDIVYEFIFTYMNHTNSLWLIGAIVYE